MVCRHIPWANTPAQESVSRLSHSQHSICAGRATLCARVTQEIEQAMRKGRKAIRYALYNATKYVCHWDPTFADYLAKKRAEGKHYNIAISHAAKKLVRLIFAMEKSRQPYCSAL